MTRLMIKARTAAEASDRYKFLRDASGESASTFPEGVWRGFRISYNGRIWNEQGKAFYPSREDSPDIWQDSCA